MSRKKGSIFSRMGRQKSSIELSFIRNCPKVSYFFSNTSKSTLVVSSAPLKLYKSSIIWYWLCRILKVFITFTTISESLPINPFFIRLSQFWRSSFIWLNAKTKIYGFFLVNLKYLSQNLKCFDHEGWAYLGNSGSRAKEEGNLIFFLLFQKLELLLDLIRQCGGSFRSSERWILIFFILVNNCFFSVVLILTCRKKIENFNNFSKT